MSRGAGPILLCALMLLSGCAIARCEPTPFAFALGKDSVATCYGPAPELASVPEGQRVEERRQEIDRTFPARDEKRHTTITTPFVPELAAAAQPLTAQAHGSAISETFGGVLRLVARTAWHALKAVFGAPIP